MLKLTGIENLAGICTITLSIPLQTVTAPPPSEYAVASPFIGSPEKEALIDEARGVCLDGRGVLARAQEGGAATPPGK